MSADRGWWQEPVTIEMGSGVRCNVSSSAQAERVISEMPSLQAAAAAVREARANALDQVRQAKARKIIFETTAHAAGVLLPTIPRPPSTGKPPTKWNRKHVLKRDR